MFIFRGQVVSVFAIHTIFPTHGTVTLRRSLQHAMYSRRSEMKPIDIVQNGIFMADTFSLEAKVSKDGFQKVVPKRLIFLRYEKIKKVA